MVIAIFLIILHVWFSRVNVVFITLFIITIFTVTIATIVIFQPLLSHSPPILYLAPSLFTLSPVSILPIPKQTQSIDTISVTASAAIEFASRSIATVLRSILI